MTSFTDTEIRLIKYTGTLSKEDFLEEGRLKTTLTTSSNEEGLETLIGRVVKNELETQLNPLKDYMDNMNDNSEYTVMEIKKLRKELLSVNNQLLEKNERIEKLLTARKNTKRIYYTGLIMGLLSIVGGLFLDFMFIIIGIGIAATALVGIHEARENGW